MPIFDARPRVLCDTNVIGDLLALSGGDLRNDFIRLARAGVAFHINAYVLDGICYALIADPQQQAEGVRNSGNLGAVDPRQLAALLAALLEPEIPVFPYQHYLYDLVGFGGTPVDQCVAQTRKLTQEYVAWRALMERTAMLDPVLLSVVAEAAGRHNEVRHQYSESIARPPTWKRTGNENDIPALLEQAAPEFARRFDAKYGNTASVRCDALVRSHALLALHQWYDGRPADLTSKRQRGTMYDQCMLDGLAVPAYLITGDKPFRARVRESASCQASWVMSASEFVDAWNRGRVGVLEFPNAG